MRRILPGVAILLGALACRGDDSTSAGNGEYGGTLVISTGADAAGLMPPLIRTIQENTVVDIIFERLAEPGMSLNSVGDEGFTPELAQSWQWSDDSLSIAFSLLPGAHFHDGQPVTARDVAFTYDVYSDPRTESAESELLAQIDSVTVRDSLTVVFWFARRYPQQFFDATYHMRILPEHVLAAVPRRELATGEFARSPVGSGQFKFARWDPGALIELHADTTHARGRPYLDRIVWTITPDHAAAMTRVLAQDADFLEQVTADKVGELASHADVALAKYLSLDLAYLQFNLRDPRSPNGAHPIFGNRQLRRAIAMAIDRDTLVQRVFDSLAIVPAGPFTRALASSDSTIPQIPYDPAQARKILDSLGWRDRNGDGIRERGGRPLRFSLVTPSTSQNRYRMAVLVQDMLEKIGVRVDVQQMDINPFMSHAMSRTFDALFSATHYDPSPASIRQSWTSSGARADGGNLGSYRNPAFDRIIDTASTEMVAERSHGAYRRAYETIVGDAPAIWMYEIVNYAVHNKRVLLAPMRADAWWANIGAWKIAPDGRLPRDGGGEARAAN
jgi:peptide/nickel transport system substrate-binding protein